VVPLSGGGRARSGGALVEVGGHGAAVRLLRRVWRWWCGGGVRAGADGVAVRW
jgi:hypothetical protein